MIVSFRESNIKNNDMKNNDDGEMKSSDALLSHSHRLQGMRMRDEFLCPITYELLREPVVALDGHTYEKAAIEKWLKSNHTSPRSGETMEDQIIPNTNLKKLIQDMINEGGAGLYTNDVCDAERLFDVFAEKVLILKCVGPPESDWNMQSFQVTHLGCIGGRKNQVEEAQSSHQKDFMLFRDPTVSRKHFEISAVSDRPGKYLIQDLGSAGGTFIRIQAGQRKRLNAGMMLLLGKHQFIISSIDDAGMDSRQSSFSAAINSLPETGKRPPTGRKYSTNLSNNAALEELASQSEQLIAELSTSGSKDENQYELEKRLRELNSWLSMNSISSASGKGGGGGGGCKESDEGRDDKEEGKRGNSMRSSQEKSSTRLSRDDSNNNNNNNNNNCNNNSNNSNNNNNGNNNYYSNNNLNNNGYNNNNDNNNNNNNNREEEESDSDSLVNAFGNRTKNYSNKNINNNNAKNNGNHNGNNGNNGYNENGSNGIEKNGNGNENSNNGNGCNGNGNMNNGNSSSGRKDCIVNHQGMRCTITCFNPDGSPLQGKSFVVTCEGASLGRKPTNDIVLSGYPAEGDEDAVVNIDTAISSDHARIEMDQATGCFFIIDGTVSKPSLNGTWFRLSGPHQSSSLFPIESKMELLIGVLRFSVSESMTISEKLVESKDDVKMPIYSDSADSGNSNNGNSNSHSNGSQRISNNNIDNM